MKKQKPKKIWLVIGIVDYETRDVLSVWDTFDAAVTDKMEYEANKTYYDSFAIEQFYLNNITE